MTWATKWEKLKCDPQLLTELVPKPGLLKMTDFGRASLTSETSNMH